MMDERAVIRINVSVADKFWSEVDVKFVQQVAAAVLDQEGPFDDAELTIRVTDDKEIQELNRTYRQVDEPTDVLSFGNEEDSKAEIVLPGEVSDQFGDVVISLPAAQRQAKEHGHDLKRELGWLVTHGVLQLLGYTHDSPPEERVMRHREEMALSSLGLSRDPETT